MRLYRKEFMAECLSCGRSDSYAMCLCCSEDIHAILSGVGVMFENYPDFCEIWPLRPFTKDRKPPWR